MLATIDLDPQDGDLELIKAIEQSFGVEIHATDCAGWRTAGDVHATLAALIPPGSPTGPCPTTMAFFRLRAALGDRTARPATPLAPYARGRPARLFRRLARATGLRMPAKTLTLLGTVALLTGFIALCVCALASIGSGTIAGVIARAAGIGLVASIGLVALDPGRLPADGATLGDLAERVAALNFAALRQSGARAMPGDCWSALCRLLSEITGVDAEAIGPDSYLFKTVMLADQAA